jgi:hypothetical protein
MPIRALLQHSAFGPEQIIIITAAFQQTLSALKISDGSHPLADQVARTLFDLATQSETLDVDQLREGTLKAFAAGR